MENERECVGGASGEARPQPLCVFRVRIRERERERGLGEARPRDDILLVSECVSAEAVRAGHQAAASLCRVRI